LIEWLIDCYGLCKYIDIVHSVDHFSYAILVTRKRATHIILLLLLFIY